MGFLSRNIKRVIAYQRSVKNLSETETGLVSEFGFGEGSVCFVSGNISPKVLEYLASSGVTLRKEDLSAESIRSCYEDIPSGSCVLALADGKPIEEIFSVKAETGLEGYIYIPYPNSVNVVQVFEYESIPGDDELRSPLLINKASSSDDCKLLVFCKDNPAVIKSVKFNTMRAPAFRVNTVIISDQSGKKVLKRAGCKEALKHIKRIVDNKDLLSEAYSSVVPADCVLNGDELEIKFIEGEDLLKGTDLANDPLDKIRDDIRKVMDEILDYKKTPSDFEETEQFKLNFPGIHPKASEKSLPVINLDSNIDNFKKVGDKVVCIDYEWTVSFPLPIRYVEFRTLHFYYKNNAKVLSPRISRIDFIKLFGFTSEDIKTFFNMELCFQQYVEGLGDKGSKF